MCVLVMYDDRTCSLWYGPDLYQLHQLYVPCSLQNLAYFDVNCSPVDHEELWQPAWGVRTGMSCHVTISSVIANMVYGSHYRSYGFFSSEGTSRRRRWLHGIQLS